MRKVFKFFTAALCFSAAGLVTHAQTLLTYGNQSVSKAEFLKAYQKNNAGKKTTEQSYRDYLELYTRYKLKVKAAFELGMDTLPNQLTEMKNFRSQVVDGYIKDDASLNKLVNEAFARGQKDIHLAQLFIAIPKNALPADTLKAFQKANAAYADLKAGKSFADLAKLYSDDPSAKTNHSDIGFITVFTLPYELENVVYVLKPGQFSKPFRSAAGYHIFKNIEERKAIGRIRTAQILLLFPPNATDAQKIVVKQQADSMYDVISAGADFASLAKKYSGDNLSYQTGGEIAEFGAGRYEPEFENAAFALKKDGDISRPVQTAFGYHIIKRIARKPAPLTGDKVTLDAFRQKVLNDPRNEYAKKTLLQKILRDEAYKPSAVSSDALWAYTDSVLRHRPLPIINGIDEKTTLFSFGDKGFTLKNWLDYVKTAKPVKRPTDPKSNKEWFDEYLQSTAFDYYREHLETYNNEFAYQLNEFREGNLLFEIMQHKIWEKASSDSVGLEKYYSLHKDKYWWESSADAVLFTCNNENTASDLKKKIQQENISAWRKWIDSSGASAQADSGRFEMAQLPIAEQKAFTAGQFTSMLTNQNDNTVTLAYIVKVYNERSPRNFTDARGFVINDYQAYLEDNWIADLKKKYPVKTDEQVFKSLPK